ncbi:putative FERM domain-containing protein FRMD8P1 [Amphiura filiformis]|uniref:putative FERM domain-containing protein FRMD8P1 n=1 Tax=Amphiura filiformis TaxID=82378 RepID=UPI003B211F24
MTDSETPVHKRMRQKSRHVTFNADLFIYPIPMASAQMENHSRNDYVQLRLITGRSKMHPAAAVAPSPLGTLPGMRRLGSTSSSRSCKPTDVCVFLKDGSGHEFFLDNALVETAHDLQQRMMESLGMPESATEVFNIWIVSPLLQLQLKPYHIPFKLCRQWPDLLDKFTIATEQQKANDEPVLTFQRNAFFPKSKEKTITDSKTLVRLFEEARYNVLEGNYPCEPEDYEYLAAILAWIQHGTYPARREYGLFKDRLQEYVPLCMCKGGSRWLKNKQGFSNIESRIFRQWEDISKKVKSKADCYRLYLQFCWKLPFYGSVLFTGQIERSNTGIGLLDCPDRPVHIAINRDGVFVMDIIKQELLLGLMYDELSWEYTEPEKNSETCLSCLWLQFDMDQGRRKISHVLQIFSKQSVMMNAMIEACVDELNKQDIQLIHHERTVMDGLLSSGDNTPSTSNDDQDMVDPSVNPLRVAREAAAPAMSESLPVKEPKTCISNQVDRLCLATFSEEGTLIKTKAKRPFSFAGIFGK